MNISILSGAYVSRFPRKWRTRYLLTFPERFIFLEIKLGVRCRGRSDHRKKYSKTTHLTNFSNVLIICATNKFQHIILLKFEKVKIENVVMEIYFNLLLYFPLMKIAQYFWFEIFSNWDVKRRHFSCNRSRFNRQ